MGAERVCSVSSAGSAVDIGALSRPFLPTEANLTNLYFYVNANNNPFTYKCAQGITTRTTIQIDVAIEGATIAATMNGIAAKCIASLPGGGLTLDQVRWIYSNYVLARLLTTGLSPSAVPKSDGNNSTHLWSELGGANCPATEIQISGSPKGSETFELVVQSALTDHANGETIAMGRYLGYYSDPNDNHTNLVNYLNSNPDAIGFFPTSYLNANSTGNLFVASLKGSGSSCCPPTVTTLGNGCYPLSRRIYMEVRSDDASVLAKVRPLLSFGYSKMGSELVAGTGLAPIPISDRILMLSRVGAPGGVNLSSIECGYGFYATIDGSATVYPLVLTWSRLFSEACGTQFVLSDSGDVVGAARVCGNSSLGNVTDVAMLDRPFKSSDAVLADGKYPYEFQCVNKTDRYIRQAPIALDAIVVSFVSGGISAKCISSLPGGGLSVDQIRWIYSSYSRAQLVASGWNASSVPNNDGNDATHLWSELGGKGCRAREIKIAGPPRTSEKFAFFSSVVFRGVDETIASTRPCGYYSYPEGNGDIVVQYLMANKDAVGLLNYVDYVNNRNTVSSSTVRNLQGDYVAPNVSSVSSGTYNPLTQTLYLNPALSYFSSQATVFLVSFGFNNDFLVQAVGLIPLSPATKSLVLTRNLFLPLAPCFSETSTVEVLGKGAMSITNLKIGDMVKNAQGQFDQVYSLAHFAPHVDVEFVQIHLAEAMGQPLEITPEHMLYVNGFAIPALAVSVGDQVKLVTRNVTALVVSVKRIVRRGIYGPLTMSGTIAVNDIACSTYVDLQHDSGVLIIGGYKTPMRTHFLAHMFQALHRLFCKFSLALCQAETHDEHGLSTRLAWPLSAAEWFFQQNAFVMMAVLVPVIILGVLIYALETVLASQVLILVALATWVVLKRCKRDEKCKQGI